MQKQVLPGLPRFLLLSVVTMLASLPCLSQLSPCVAKPQSLALTVSTKSGSVPPAPKTKVFIPPENTSTPVENLSFYNYSDEGWQANSVSVKLSTAPPAVPTAAVTGARAEILRSLRPDELQPILAGLKPLPQPVVATTVPIDVAPRPPTGNITKLRFPASALTMFRPPPPVKSAPLSVSRWSPSSGSTIAEETTQLVVQFSQQMVPLSSVDAYARWQPVLLSPQPAGKWRWLDTRTIVFEPSNYRFPMSTIYRVSIPKGTVSKVTGAGLAQAVTWQFQSQELKLQHHYPSSLQDFGRPELFVHFNQAIDCEKVFPHISVYSTEKNGARSKVPVRLLTSQETGTNGVLKTAIKNFKKNTWLCCKPINKLAPGKIITLIINRQSPSAEGPLLSTKDQQFWFETTPLPIKMKFGLAVPSNTKFNQHPGDAMRVDFNSEIKQTGYG